MIRDPEGFERWQAAQAASEPLDYRRNFRIIDALLDEARALGVWPPADPWEGLEEKLRWIARLHAHGRVSR